MTSPLKERAAHAGGDADQMRADIEWLFRREAPRLLRFFRHRMRDSEVARDLVQETFLRLVRSSFAPGLRNPAAYLQRIARNLLLDRAKRSDVKLALLHLPLDEAAEAQVAPDQLARLEADQIRAQYERAVGELSPKTRRVFLLHRVDGLTYKEIQQQLGVSLGTVEYHIMRALAHIDRVLGEE